MNKNRLNNRNRKIEIKYAINNSAKNFRFQMQYRMFKDVTINPENEYPD